MSTQYKNNSLDFILKSAIILLFLSIGLTAMAQTNNRALIFKSGEQYQRETLINSSSSLQRGTQKIDVNSSSNVNKLYTVNSTAPNLTVFTVMLTQLDNEINTLGQKFKFNSENKEESNSAIATGLNFMLNKPIDISVDNNGIILSSDSQAELATDTLLAFAGIKPEIFKKGMLLDIFADLSQKTNLNKGFTWSESKNVDSQKTNTKFWIADVNEKYTIVKFSSVLTSALINSNSNGTYVVENSSGIVLDKLIYTVSIGYEISAGNVIYGVSRSTSIAEKTRKVLK